MVDFPVFFLIPYLRHEKAIFKKHLFRIFGKQALPVMEPVLSAKRA